MQVSRLRNLSTMDINISFSVQYCKTNVCISLTAKMYVVFIEIEKFIKEQ